MTVLWIVLTCLVLFGFLAWLLAATSRGPSWGFLEKTLTVHLELFGYQQIKLESETSSRCLAWEGPGGQFRLIWDGEQCYTLQQTEMAEPSTWRNLAVIPSDRWHLGESELLNALNLALSTLYPDRPAFPLTVHWEDDEARVLDDAWELATSLESFNSEPPDPILVTDRRGRPVRLVVERIHVRVCELR
jgi:hypothetical protein